MTIKIALTHRTRYRYDRSIRLGPQIVRLRPAPHCRTPIASYSLELEPDAHFINWQQDPHGNHLARITVPEPTREFAVNVGVVAEMVAINPFDFFVEPSAEEHPFQYDAELKHDLAPYLRLDEPGPRLSTWLAAAPREPARSIDRLTALNQKLADDIDYVVRMEPGVQSPERTLELGRGSCRDSAWLLVHLLRHHGIAARFASGYLIQLAPDQKPLDGPEGPVEDFCDLHAWAEAYLPGAGWIGLDPTSGLLAGEGHIPLACSPAPGGASPISGALDPCEVEFEFEMQVARLVEAPRVTAPYTDEVWNAIDQEGERVDERLHEGDVRLTMGGEPTFVSVDDPDGDEWNTAAVGPTKARLAAELTARLRARMAPHGAQHFGQGKWYPGEPLPRWAFGLHWRSDSTSLWDRPDLIATESSDVANLENADRLIQRIAEGLGVPTANAMPAYEDPWHHIGVERRLPPGTELSEIPLDDAGERRRLAEALERGLGAPVGFVLPVQAWQSRDGRGWRSHRWPLPTSRLFLMPGDSPIGLRLPMESLPPTTPAARVDVVPEVPFDRPEPLPSRHQASEQRLERASQPPLPPGVQAGDVRTALAVQPREGLLYVFLPPVASATEYVDLLGTVEQAAADLDLPVRLEGYDPPPDSRLRTLKVTPDPGVIEVNVVPSAGWRELVASTELLYEEARATRLATEKFMLDGRHLGTGGGNHIVLGGATPADSPFLRRPDLLRSILAYFNNHPSMSFLFSGLFIGPTSQAPRVDQARDDALFELSLAFEQLPQRGEEVPPWVVDRVLRDVLVDATGNTHRTEICIDKLYSPDSATGRLGLVEFRGFEMQPHARMNLAQQLLIRALVAWFWDEPYTRELQHWGTNLHDRFMLPEFIWQDFADVIGDLRRAGFGLELDWFEPHREFRFPLLGQVEGLGLTLELRSALEPWHVTGESGVAGGTARYVDSSLERLQVQLRGAVDARHVVLCNGRPVPLHPGAAARVGGVRYRAWQPPHCLHPTIPSHAPLKFDVVDSWTGLSVLGCGYHVGHPGGRNYETFPVNALEAQGRRLGRFSAYAHHAGRPMDVVPESPHQATPLTLDLRAKPRSHA